MSRTFLTAEWRKLIMAQYEVPATALTPALPRGLELDLFHGHCYVSLVGFLFDRVRVLGVAIPHHIRFEEVNLRFYVKRTEADGRCKRGVVFLREFVPRYAISLVARSLYDEPYATLPTRHRFASSGDDLQVEYEWRYQSRWQRLAVTAGAEAQPIQADSEAEFITEHYWGYTRRRQGHTSEYGVEHPRWSVYPIRDSQIEVDFGRIYGETFAALTNAAPASVLLAEGSAVRVMQGNRLAE
jgi:uncharacterized protein YqjF (DUF2071 family)